MKNIRRQLLQILFQINHIHKLYIAFEHRMIVIVGKEIPEPVRYPETATFVKRQDGRRFACAHKHCFKVGFIIVGNKLYQCAAGF